MANVYEGAMDNIETPEVTDPELAEDAEEMEVESEEPEVIDPEAEEDAQGAGEDPEEAADVPEGKRSRDSAFAEMRRAREEAEGRNEELQARIDELERAQRQSELVRAASEMGLTEAEIQQVVADAEEAESQERERAGLVEENERLNQELMDVRINQAMEKDLRDIQAIDPSVKSLEDLGEDFFKFRGAMDGLDAYFAVKAKQERTGYGAAPKMGKANQASVPRDYYTSDELDSMSNDEILANWDKVQRSMDRL